MVRKREHQIWKFHASDQPSERPSSWSGRAKPLYGNYLQRTCDRPEDRAPPSGKNFSEILGQLITQLSVRMAPCFFQARRSFELSTYK
jgi:hypothetical protein